MVGRRAQPAEDRQDSPNRDPHGPCDTVAGTVPWRLSNESNVRPGVPALEQAPGPHLPPLQDE